MTDMNAMVLTTDRRVVLERRPEPEPRADQVLLEVDLCGICGSDLHAPAMHQVYTGGYVLGHESAGRIRAVGAEVEGWQVGQRVAVNPNGNICGKCDACRAGRFNFCVPATLERAVGLQADGGLAPLLVTSPATLHALPDGMDRIAAGWVEPVATALRAVRQAGDLTARSVLVIGGGPIGHVVCRLARLAGAAPVFLSEPSAERRRFAGASHVDEVFDPGEASAAIADLGVDVVIECSGSERGMRAGVEALAPGGILVVVGGGNVSGLDPMTILLKELRIQGSFTYVDEFDETISLLAGGGLEVADLTTAIVGLEEAPAAFEALGDAGTMKVLVAPNG